MKKFIKVISASLAAVIVLGAVGGCDNHDRKKTNKYDVDLTGDDRTEYLSFGLDVLKANYDGGNQLVSPLSILTALTMVANGADGITLEEFEDVFGMSVDEANKYIYMLSKSFESSEDCKTNNANAIWVNEDYGIEFDKEYLNTMSEFYSSDVYKAEFNKSTEEDMNKFVDKYTDGMIPEIVDDLDSNSAMILINALSFEGKWSKEYRPNDIEDMTFHNLDGSTAIVQMMSSEEGEFIETSYGYGVMKNYEGGEYKFVALLPNEDVVFDDFIDTLEAEDFLDAVNNPVTYKVYTKIPEFTSENTYDLSDVLVEMGLKTAFDDDANFRNLTKEDNSLCIDSVIHKTFIEVNRDGTKAAAATKVDMMPLASAIDDIPTFEVTLDRPFVYAIVETETMTPVFIGITAQM